MTNESCTGLPEPSAAGIATFRHLDNSVYAELMRMARAQLGRSGTLSLDAPSLVHEAYLRFARNGTIQATQRGIFFAYAAQVMRTVIIDYLRERHAQKRGGGERMVTLSTGIPGTSFDDENVEQLHDALLVLAKIDPRSHFVVELRYFSGVGEAEIAQLLGVSVPTVKRDWRKARAFLFDAIGNPSR